MNLQNELFTQLNRKPVTYKIYMVPNKLAVPVRLSVHVIYLRNDSLDINKGCPPASHSDIVRFYCSSRQEMVIIEPSRSHSLPRSANGRCVCVCDGPKERMGKKVSRSN
ncbi:hypothetical protein CEXT_183321 [Caerostris extrusa]|uniref:Uncharacterized protein n=1 Tax=Caerostris extrusa TaxID=172846 RepID=A0AAV4PK63_CAEEX|nr:hypothetical protein CEXT_183321 [Caerostris extrusa]